MSTQSIIIITFCLNSLFTISAQPVKPDSYPDPSTIQTQILNSTVSTAPGATIPAFPEQSQASVCPLNLPENLFHDINSACGPPKTRQDKSDPDFYSTQLYRNRCCPVLAAWLYSAYAETGLSLAAAAAATPKNETTPFDMPDLPDDSETCVDNLDKALDDKGVGLPRINDTCDVFFCNCGIRLHPFSCPEAFRVNKRGKLVAGDAVKRLEIDCFRYGRGTGIGACSKCLNTLYSLKADTSERSNTSDRSRKMHDQECELMGLTWLRTRIDPHI